MIDPNYWLVLEKFVWNRSCSNYGLNKSKAFLFIPIWYLKWYIPYRYSRNIFIGIYIIKKCCYKYDEKYSQGTYGSKQDWLLTLWSWTLFSSLFCLFTLWFLTLYSWPMTLNIYVTLYSWLFDISLKALDL